RDGLGCIRPVSNAYSCSGFVRMAREIVRVRLGAQVIPHEAAASWAGGMCRILGGTTLRPLVQDAEVSRQKSFPASAPSDLAAGSFEDGPGLDEYDGAWLPLVRVGQCLTDRCDYFVACQRLVRVDLVDDD